ncbi:hypothetical protein QQG55_56760 [Brugia pahangi]
MSADSDDYVVRNVDAKLQQDSEWLKTFEENLKKSRNLNNEITTLLESFRNRLVQLEQSVVPLYEKPLSYDKSKQIFEKY